MKKKNFLLLFVLPLLLTGCSTTPENLIPEGFIEDLTGTYVSKEGTLEVDNESIKLNGKALTPTKYVVEEFTENEETVEHAVTYFKDGKDEYRIYFSGDNGMYKLALEKKTTLGGKTGYSLISKFMPTIEEFTGSFTWDGSGDAYNTVLTFGNSYNSYYDAFEVSAYSSYAGAVLDAYYLTSSKVIYNNELRTVVHYYDFVDNYLYYTFLLEELDGVIGLADYDAAINYGISYLDYAYDPLFLSFNYFSEEKSIQGMLDPSASTITYGETAYTYAINRDKEKGQVVTLTNGTSEVKVSPSPYGMIWEENNISKTYVHNDVSYLYGEYSHGDSVFKFLNESGEDKVYINNAETPFTFSINNNRKSIKVNVDGVETHFTPFKQNLSILASTAEGERFYVNEKAYSSSYGHTFVSKGLGTYDNIVITPDFLVNYHGKLISADLYYDPTLLYPYLEFTTNGSTYRFEFIEENIGAAALTCNGETTYFFNEEEISGIYDSYTFQGEEDIVISKFSLEFEGETVDYAIEPYYYEMSFSYLTSIKFTVNEKEITAFSAPKMLSMDIVDENGTATTKTSIAMSEFNKLVGEYYLDALYGPEKFKLTADGHFYADTLNSTQDGLVYDVEYPYSLIMTYNAYTGEGLPGIIFYPQANNTSIGIQLIKVGDTLTLGGSVYTAKHFFDFRGVYVADDGSGVIEIREDSLYVDGEEATISDVSYDEYGTYITATSNYSEYTYTFMNFDGEFYVSSDKNGYTSYTKSTFDFNSLVGTYVSGSTTYTLSRGALPTNPDVPYGFILSDGFLQYTTYSIVLKNGTVAMKFDTGMSKIYIYAGSTGNVLEVESGALPPPPPPPPPPLI